MPKSLSKFYDIIPGSRYELKDVIQTLDDSGDLREIDDIDVIINSINNVLYTVKGTYIFDPNYGVGLHLYLFEPSDKKTEQSILREVREAIKIYESRAKIDVDVEFYSNKKGFRLNIKVDNGNKSRTSKLIIDETLLRDLK